MSAERGAVAIAQRVRAGWTTASAVVETALVDIAARDPGLNCFRDVLADDARNAAAAIDKRHALGGALGPLAGVPFAVKELFDVAGRTTLAGSLLRSTAAPASRDATLVAALRAADAVLIGTLNMDEFAYGFSTENEHYGATRNPHDVSRIAGGSSGGSAAAVAAGLVPITLGSDTNGSIRVPAALCGVYGMKPTFDRLSRSGTTPFVASLDHVGPFASTAADLAAVYRVLEHASGAQLDGTASKTPAIENLRVGVLSGWFRTGATREALAAVDRVAAAFPDVSLVELPQAHRARSAAFCITAAEAGNLHLPDLRDRPHLFDLATRERLMAGALLPGHIVTQSQRFRRWFQQMVAAVFEDYDVLLAPATPCSAPKIGVSEVEIDGKYVAVRANLGIYTQPISFIGLPVVTVPVITPQSMPLGVQLIARPRAEQLLLDVACALEEFGVVGAASAEAIAA